MSTEQTPQNKETKCNCVKQLAELKKQMAVMKRDIELLRRVLLSTK